MFFILVLFTISIASVFIKAKILEKLESKRLTDVERYVVSKNPKSLSEVEMLLKDYKSSGLWY